MDTHNSYEDVAARRREVGAYREGYEEARRAFELGRAVRERRLALGLSQAAAAARAGMTQSALSRLEAGGTVPTIPVLERVSAALDAELVIAIAPRAT
ncbi:helix-turn-helix domain-containing protein [Rathayibacter soli]|uniref:helix-turn-helix domain-containing protein n=1 Tax=Rathayibacter soli TaxID=3144168 RepID=UPI0027E42068|nr:helix-turn-helix transcriptional regulator [Glaciibacter superstes]